MVIAGKCMVKSSVTWTKPAAKHQYSAAPTPTGKVTMKAFLKNAEFK